MPVFAPNYTPRVPRSSDRLSSDFPFGLTRHAVRRYRKRIGPKGASQDRVRSELVAGLRNELIQKRWMAHTHQWSYKCRRFIVIVSNLGWIVTILSPDQEEDYERMSSRTRMPKQHAVSSLSNERPRLPKPIKTTQGKGTEEIIPVLSETRAEIGERCSTGSPSSHSSNASLRI